MVKVVRYKHIMKILDVVDSAISEYNDGNTIYVYTLFYMKIIPKITAKMNTNILINQTNIIS